MAGSASSSCALSVAMTLNDGGVDHGVSMSGFVRAGRESLDKNVGREPVAVAL
jgi:hypothetical protein